MTLRDIEKNNYKKLMSKNMINIKIEGDVLHLETNEKEIKKMISNFITGESNKPKKDVPELTPRKVWSQRSGYKPRGLNKILACPKCGQPCRGLIGLGIHFKKTHKMNTKERLLFVKNQGQNIQKVPIYAEHEGTAISVPIRNLT
jgi:hypothetical protein